MSSRAPHDQTDRDARDHAVSLGASRRGEVRAVGSRRWVRKLKRPPGNIRRPTKLKIACFRNSPVRPGYGRLALSKEARESKLLFHQRNKKIVAAGTHAQATHLASVSPTVGGSVSLHHAQPTVCPGEF